MSCVNVNCKIVSETERSIECWLCTNIWHSKCAGLSAKVVDVMYGDSDSGLKWCCKNCRKINVEFYKFVKDYSSEMAEIGKEMWSLYSRFNKYASLFDRFPELNAFVCSPDVVGQKRKRSTKKTLPKKLDVGTPSASDRTSLDEPTTSSASVSVPCSVSVDQQRVALAVTPRVDKVVSIQEGNSMGNPEMNPKPPANVASRAGGKSKTLTVVPAKKVVFVSRFAPDTSSEDIDFYIRSKIEGDFYLKTFKIRSSSSNSRSSFKIIVQPKIFDKLISSDFWPPKAFVKEFVDRVDNLAQLPLRPPSSNSSKN